MNDLPEFPAFPKIPRLSRECTITEKIDGTNGVIRIGEDGVMLVGSRTRWITPEDDNYGFAKWCHGNRDDLLALGSGTHYGEWWGDGIQKRYPGFPRRFSLFNTKRWGDPAVRPACCDVVPVLYQGLFDGVCVADALSRLAAGGSVAAPGCMRPEGIVIWHDAARTYFKKTMERDEEWKGKTQ